jgi:hypothetical protein
MLLFHRRGRHLGQLEQVFSLKTESPPIDPTISAQWGSISMAKLGSMARWLRSKIHTSSPLQPGLSQN